MHAVDHELLTRLLDMHSPALVLYAQQLCDQPEDVVQEAFVRLMRERPAPANAVGWLYRVVRNRAISASRSAGTRSRHETNAATERQPWFMPTSDAAIDATSAVAALESLPIDEREVVVLRLWGGHSFEEIAALIGKTTSTAHRRYESGIATMRDKFSKTLPNAPRIQ
jgi:RNA polymerase sigma factor (sigma-70 family)